MFWMIWSLNNKEREVGCSTQTQNPSVAVNGGTYPFLELSRDTPGPGLNSRTKRKR